MEESAYNKLILQEDSSVDEPPDYLNHDKPQVTFSMVRPTYIWTSQRVLEITLAGLAALLLAVDIGLGVYYNNLTDESRAVMSISREVAALNAAYDAAATNQAEAQMRLRQENIKQQVIRWHIEHQVKRNVDYKYMANNLHRDITILKSHVPALREGCRHCLPRWILIDSACFFLSLSETRRQWQEAREFCKKHDSDLAVVDSLEKQTHPEPQHRMASGLDCEMWTAKEFGSGWTDQN
ncbi:uncharacterized protein LOC144206751 isoform X2 [Stigmatopora nigra]